MINFITQHWIAIVIYLIGCILSYGRINAQVEIFKKSRIYDGWTIISSIVWVMLSWIGFIMIFGMWEKGDKFFKWLPIVLLWCMVGVGCNHSREGRPIVLIEGDVNSGISTTCEYYTTLGGIWNFPVNGDCTLYKVGDTLWLSRKVQPLDTLK